MKPERQSPENQHDNVRIVLAGSNWQISLDKTFFSSFYSLLKLTITLEFMNSQNTLP